jgi:membrane-associated phospholipid phosphatase
MNASTAIPLALFLGVIVPSYIVIAELMPGRVLHAPEVALDRAFPLQPTWALVYGTLYLFLILLPVFVVRQQELIRRTVFAYLTIWLVAYACFLEYPTIAPRPVEVAGGGFLAWGLRFLYSADPPYNCFPSLHVAHSFVSAAACYRVHRGVGIAAGGCATLIGVSTLYTKQHYVLDVVTGMLLAFGACMVFLRKGPRQGISAIDREAAPTLAIGVAAVVCFAAACFWAAYRFGAGA